MCVHARPCLCLQAAGQYDRKACQTHSVRKLLKVPLSPEEAAEEERVAAEVAAAAAAEVDPAAAAAAEAEAAEAAAAAGKAKKLSPAEQAAADEAAAEEAAKAAEEAAKAAEEEAAKAAAAAAEANYDWTARMEERCDVLEWTPLVFAARYGTEEDLQLLIDYGADVNVRDVHGATPLHKAATAGRAAGCAKMRALVAAGADLGASDRCGMTPLHGERALQFSCDSQRAQFAYGLGAGGVSGDQAAGACMP